MNARETPGSITLRTIADQPQTIQCAGREIMVDEFFGVDTKNANGTQWVPSEQMRENCEAMCYN